MKFLQAFVYVRGEEEGELDCNLNIEPVLKGMGKVFQFHNKKWVLLVPYA